MAGGEVLYELWLDGVHRAHKVLVGGVTPSWATRGDASMPVGSRGRRGVAKSSGACRHAETTKNAIPVHGHGGQRLDKKDSVQGTESGASAASNGSAATR